MGCTSIQLWGPTPLCSWCSLAGLHFPPTEGSTNTSIQGVPLPSETWKGRNRWMSPSPRTGSNMSQGLRSAMLRVYAGRGSLKPHKCHLNRKVVIIRAGCSLHCLGMLCALRSWVTDKDFFEQNEHPQQERDKIKKRNLSLLIVKLQTENQSLLVKRKYPLKVETPVSDNLMALCRQTLMLLSQLHLL